MSVSVVGKVTWTDAAGRHHPLPGEVTIVQNPDPGVIDFAEGISTVPLDEIGRFTAQVDAQVGDVLRLDVFDGQQGWFGLATATVRDLTVAVVLGGDVGVRSG